MRMVSIGFIVIISKSLPCAVVFTTRTARLPRFGTERSNLKQTTTDVTANGRDSAVPLELTECTVAQFDHQILLAL